MTVRKRTLANPTATSGNIASTIGSDYSLTAGAVFTLYTSTSNNTYSNGPQSATIYSCTITANAQCDITVPYNSNTGGKRYWVVETTPSLVPGSTPPAAATYANPDLYVGDYQGPQDRLHVVGLTSPVSSGGINTLPKAINGNNGATSIGNSDLGNNISTAEGASFGAVANSLKNPTLEPQCTAENQPRIAIIVDESASISNSQWDQMRDALVGVGSGSVLGILQDKAAVSILGFGTTTDWHYGSTGAVPVTSANRSTIANSLPGNRPGGFANATNWDAALSEIATKAANYDLVLFVTDGAPNVILNGTQVSGYNVTLRSIEAPIYAANAIKAAGTRVVAVGVGNGASGNVGANLRAVSGEIKNSDYVQGDWDKLNQMVADIAKSATCTVPVEVSKTTVDKNDVTTTYAGNWEFTATEDGTQSSLSGVATQTTSSGTTGTAKWDLDFSDPNATADLTLTETLQDGWTLDKVECTLAGLPVTTTIVDGKSVTLPGITPKSEKVACTFTNTQPQDATLTLIKSVDNTAYAGTAVPTDWTLTAASTSKTITGATGATAITAAKVPAGTYALSESGGPDGYDPSNWDCGAKTVTAGAVTVAAGDVITCTITNTAKPGGVTWSKTTEGDATLAGSEWTLAGPGGSGATANVTDCVVAPCAGPDVDPAPGKFKIESLKWGAYTLTETKAPAGFVIDSTPRTFEITGTNLVKNFEAVKNDQTPAVSLPLTGGTGSDLFLIGGGIALLGALAGGYVVRRNRRGLA